MRHLIFSIVGSPPESPSANPPGAGTIGFETEYQVGHNAPPDILIGMPASLLLLACSPRPGVARQHERFPENDSPWLHLKSEPAERPIQRLRPVAHERRQWGQTPARYSHPIDFEYFGRTPQFTSSKRRNAWDNSPALSTPLQETIRQRHPSRPASSRNRPVCMVLYPHFQQGTGLTLRIKATLSSVHTSGVLSVLVTSHAIDSPAYTGRISMPMIRSPSSMDLSRTILSPPYHSPAQRRLGISGGT